MINSHGISCALPYNVGYKFGSHDQPDLDQDHVKGDSDGLRKRNETSETIGSTSTSSSSSQIYLPTDLLLHVSQYLSNDRDCNRDNMALAGFPGCSTLNLNLSHSYTFNDLLRILVSKKNIFYNVKTISIRPSSLQDKPNVGLQFDDFREVLEQVDWQIGNVTEINFIIGDIVPKFVDVNDDFTSFLYDFAPKLENLSIERFQLLFFGNVFEIEAPKLRKLVLRTGSIQPLSMPNVGSNYSCLKPYVKLRCQSLEDLECCPLIKVDFSCCKRITTLKIYSVSTDELPSSLEVLEVEHLLSRPMFRSPRDLGSLKLLRILKINYGQFEVVNISPTLEQLHLKWEASQVQLFNTLEKFSSIKSLHLTWGSQSSDAYLSLYHLLSDRFIRLEALKLDLDVYTMASTLDKLTQMVEQMPNLTHFNDGAQLETDRLLFPFSNFSF